MAASMFKKAKSLIICPRPLLSGWKSHRFRLLSTIDSESNAKPPENVQENDKRDPFPLFASTEVQALLTRITGFDILKIAGPHLKPMERPVYKLLTDVELEKEKGDARNRLKHLLQMPPYMKSREAVRTNLVDDPDLAGFDTSKYVFVDCSFGIRDRHRSVVVRDVDGSLKEASWDTKERMNQLYNPREGRSIMKPKMFEEQHLERMINEKKYVYILNRACAQFEPDDPDFIRTSHRVYNAVNSNNDFDHLRSSRFFGPMAFYLTWYRMCDSLIRDMLNRDLLEDARDLVQLYCIINATSPGVESIKSIDPNDSEAILKVYIQTESDAKNDLTSSLQALLERRPIHGNSMSLPLM